MSGGIDNIWISWLFLLHSMARGSSWKIHSRIYLFLQFFLIRWIDSLRRSHVRNIQKKDNLLIHVDYFELGKVFLLLDSKRLSRGYATRIQNWRRENRIDDKWNSQWTCISRSVRTNLYIYLFIYMYMLYALYIMHMKSAGLWCTEFVMHDWKRKDICSDPIPR